MKQIYNEGRVVGLSAYELYVRQLVSTYPEATPLTEREWLASTISDASSMILKIPAGTTKGIHDYLLPPGSQLAGATIIYASAFQGDCQFAQNPEQEGSERSLWAVKVIDYGPLISNLAGGQEGLTYPRTPGMPGVPAHPMQDRVDVPPKPDYSGQIDQYRTQFANYRKILSGLVIQPGEWVDDRFYTQLNTQSNQEVTTQQDQAVLVPQANSTAKALNPNFSQSPFVRLYFSEPTTADFNIILHGFVYNPILKGETGFPAQDWLTSPENGDFLGPLKFPWACPILFTVTNDVLYLVNTDVADLLNRVEALETIITSMNRTLHFLEEKAIISDRED